MGKLRSLKKAKKNFFEFYYITSIANLESILKYGILSRKEVKSKGLPFKDLANNEVLKKRKSKNLDYYANLYIYPRNAMLYKLLKESDIVILGISGSLFNKTDILISLGNAASDYSTLLRKEDLANPLEFFKKVRAIEDWTYPLVKEEYINLIYFIKNPQLLKSTKISPKKFLQSEILIPEKVDPSYIEAIYVPNEDLRKKIETNTNLFYLLERRRIRVIIEPRFFFHSEEIQLTNKIWLIKGDMFLSDADALTISVNTVGIMGKGLASKAKHLFPEVYIKYQDYCKSKILTIGQPKVFYSKKYQKFFILFPTKKHWREKSKIEYIQSGLNYLKNQLDHIIKTHQSPPLKSLAMPALGCGLGQLKWEQVGPLMVKILNDFPIERVEIYLPQESFKEKYTQKSFYF